MSAKDTTHLRVRIEPGLLRRLERAREKSGRTLTGEIVHRLEHSFRKDDQWQVAKEAGRVAAEVIADEIAKKFRAEGIKFEGGGLLGGYEVPAGKPSDEDSEHEEQASKKRKRKGQS